MGWKAESSTAERTEVAPVVPLRRNRDFMLLWSGQVVSAVGSEITYVAYPLLVLALTHSPAKAGLTGSLRDASTPALRSVVPAE